MEGTEIHRRLSLRVVDALVHGYMPEEQMAVLFAFAKGSACSVHQRIPELSSTVDRSFLVWEPRAWRKCDDVRVCRPMIRVRRRWNPDLRTNAPLKENGNHVGNL